MRCSICQDLMTLGEFRKVGHTWPKHQWFEPVCMDCAAEIAEGASDTERRLAMQEVIDKMAALIVDFGPECLAECTHAAINDAVRLGAKP